MKKKELIQLVASRLFVARVKDIMNFGGDFESGVDSTPQQRAARAVALDEETVRRTADRAVRNAFTFYNAWVAQGGEGIGE